MSTVMTGNGPRSFDASGLEARKLPFFDLPFAETTKLDIADSPNTHGYTPLLRENTNSAGKGDLHEGVDIALDLEEAFFVELTRKALAHMRVSRHPNWDGPIDDR